MGAGHPHHMYGVPSHRIPMTKGFWLRYSHICKQDTSARWSISVH